MYTAYIYIYIYANICYKIYIMLYMYINKICYAFRYNCMYIVTCTLIKSIKSDE